jgi:hypothetical protein
VFAVQIHDIGFTAIFNNPGKCEPPASNSYDPEEKYIYKNSLCVHVIDSLIKLVKEMWLEFVVPNLSKMQSNAYTHLRFQFSGVRIQNTEDRGQRAEVRGLRNSGI